MIRDMASRQIKELPEALWDILLDIPQGFTASGKRFRLYAPTLGSSILASRRMAALGVTGDSLREGGAAMALLTAEGDKTGVCRFIAVHTFRAFADLSDPSVLEKRTALLARSLTPPEAAELMLVCLAMPDAESVISSTEMARDMENQKRVAEAKSKDSGTVTFGGHTVYGALVSPACKELGLTPHQVVWEIPLAQLTLLLRDTISSVYLSEDERKRIRLRSGRTVKADSPEGIEMIMKTDWR